MAGMEGMTVGEVARSTGVTVRTLHHWDAVGLLVPSGRTLSGYRAYAPADVDRLVRALAHRSLGLGLGDVRRLLDDPDADVVTLLDRQHALLVDRIAHLQAVAALVRTTREARRMGMHLDPQEVREVFGDEDPSRYAAEAEQRWGETEAYRQSQQRTASFGKDDWAGVRAQGEAVEQRLATLLADGVTADAPEAREAAEQHRAWVARSYDCSYELHRGLAGTYLADERFTAHYERRAPGLAQYVHDVLVANAEACEAGR